MKVNLYLLGADALLGGRFEPILELARLADRKGIDSIGNGDHVAVSRAAFEEEQYQGTKFPFPRDLAWYEPVTFLAAIAAVTQRIRLSMNALIAPLRPAILLAKQIATLDLISQGRVTLAIGAGWQKQEFDAANVPFEGRFGYMEEQVEACRVLWSGGPAAYHGKHVRFEELYAYPLPPQGSKLPVWFGLGATERSAERIARLADGWMAPPYEVSVISEGMQRIKAALPKYGRDPTAFPMRALLMPIMGRDGTPDIDATLAKADEWVEIGATELETPIHGLCRDKREIEVLIDKLVALRDRLS